MSFLGKSLDGGSVGFPRSAEAGPTVDHEVFSQYLSPSYADLRVADSGRANAEVLYGDKLVFSPVFAEQKVKDKQRDSQGVEYETEEPILYPGDDPNGMPMEEENLDLQEGGLEENANGDLYGLNNDGEVVVFAYQQDGMATDEFVVYKREGGEITDFRHNETIWSRGDDGRWQVLNGTTDELFDFDIRMDENGVHVTGPNADMVPVPA